MSDGSETTRKRPRLRYLILGVGAAVLVMLAIPVAAAWMLLGGDPFRGESFSPEAWAAAGDCTGLADLACEERFMECPRGSFVRSIRTDFVTPGIELTRSRALLGAPEYERPWTDGLTCDSYTLGYCSGFSIDPDSLLVCADGAGIVAEVFTIQH